MSYDEWRILFEPLTVGDDVLWAQLWNLEHDNRVEAETRVFYDRIAQLFDAYRMSSTSAEDAARRAWNEARDELVTPAHPSLGKLPTVRAEAVPREVFTYESSFAIARYRTLGVFEPTRPPRFVALRTPLKHQRHPDGSFERVKRFVWVTLSAGAVLPEDPTRLKKELGLAHFPREASVYRIRLQRTGQAVFIPTCFDAELYEAWAPPAVDEERWGVTRDLSDGTQVWPELVLESSDFRTVPPTAERMPSGDDLKAIGPIALNYRAGRT